MSTPVKKFQWCYDAIIDLMLAHPSWTKTQIAAELKYTPQAIYIITNSDTFKRHWDIRRGGLSDNLEDGLVNKLKAQAEIATDIISERIQKEKHDIAPQILLETQDAALRALGYGNKASGPATQVVLNLVDPEIALAAKVRMEKTIEHQKQQQEVKLLPKVQAAV